LYNTADVFLLSSVYEGIANVVLEAMAMEIPVVSTRSGGLDEVIEPGANGLLADVYDHESLADHLLQLANNFDQRKSIGKTARNTVLERFTIQRQVNEFEERYLSLMNKQGATN
jgi:colanic acid/amylovoran biosynthesis glycosyltransferase